METKRPFSEADWLATPELVRGYIKTPAKSIDIKTTQCDCCYRQFNYINPYFNSPKKNHYDYGVCIKALIVSFFYIQKRIFQSMLQLLRSITGLFMNGKAGSFINFIGAKAKSPWTFLKEYDVEFATIQYHNYLYFKLKWNKGHVSRQRDKFQGWMVKSFSYRKACRIKNNLSFPVLMDLTITHFKKKEPIPA